MHHGEHRTSAGAKGSIRAQAGSTSERQWGAGLLRNEGPSLPVGADRAYLNRFRRVLSSDLGGPLLEPIELLDVPLARLAASQSTIAGSEKPTRREKSSGPGPSRPRTGAAEAA